MDLSDVDKVGGGSEREVRSGLPKRVWLHEF
jgi:hypothetical protein